MLLIERRLAYGSPKEVKQLLFICHFSKGADMLPNRNLRASIYCLIALIVAGCATPYQRSGLAGGFEETQLGENIFRVNFTGNGYTSKQRAQDFTLLRCAELSAEQGFPYFVIVDGSAQSNSAYAPGVATSNTTASGSTYGNQFSGRATTTTYGGGFTFSYPTTDNTIIGLKEKPENASGVVYDSKFVVQSLRKKYELDQDRK